MTIIRGRMDVAVDPELRPRPFDQRFQIRGIGGVDRVARAGFPGKLRPLGA